MELNKRMYALPCAQNLLVTCYLVNVTIWLIECRCDQMENLVRWPNGEFSEVAIHGESSSSLSTTNSDPRFTSNCVCEITFGNLDRKG